MRARHVLTPGDRAYCALSWAEELAAPADVDEADGTARRHDALLAGLARPRADPRPPLARPDAAVGAHDQGADLHADRRDRRRAHDVAARDAREASATGTTATRGCATRRSRSRRCTSSTSTGRRTSSCSSSPTSSRPRTGRCRSCTASTAGATSPSRRATTSPGYAGARPVRIGNGAFDQRQNDVFGAVLDSILLHTRRSERLPRRLWPIVETQAECATKVWREPDQGIWEARGKPQHYVSSKLMCWVALDRAAQARRDPRRRRARRRSGARPPTRSEPTSSSTASPTTACSGSTTRPTRSTRRCCSPRSSGSFPADDERLRATVIAIADDLTEDGFVLRYRTDETDDGLSGKEGTFLICSFWLVSALAIVGELQRARDLMERLLRIASPLGLYAEEFDADTGRHLGNFPQAFSHLALIEAAARIIVPEMHGGVLSMDSYDVIIIGTGAGGGTLARHLAPSGKRILLLERGDWLPREPQNWLAQDVFVDNRYVSPDTWYDEQRQGVPAAGPLLRRRRDEALRRGALPPAQGGLRRAAAPRRDLARVADLLRRARAVLHAGRAAVPGARRPRRGSRPSRRRARRTRIRPSRTSRASSSSRTSSRRPATIRSTRRAGSCSTRRTCRTARASAVRTATAFRASCTRSPTPRCSACGRRSSTRTSRC